MQRRSCLGLMASSAALGLNMSLAACGFELRKAPSFAFKTLFSPLAESSVIGVELRRSLEANGAVRVITDARQIAEADVILDVISDLRDKLVVSRNAAGLVREFQLRQRFRFKVRTLQGKELIPDSEILQVRDLSFSESAVLAKELEEALLYREMQSDVVQQIMRRLASITGL